MQVKKWTQFQIFLSKNIEFKFVLFSSPQSLFHCACSVRAWTWSKLIALVCAHRTFYDQSNRCNAISIWIFHIVLCFRVTKMSKTINEINGILLLWEKIVLGIEKNFWNSRMKAENATQLFIFEIFPTNTLLFGPTRWLKFR